MVIAVSAKKLDRRVRREAKALLAEVRQALRRHAARLDESVRAEITRTADALEKAVQAQDHDVACAGLAKLDEAADRHLSFARRSTVAEYARSIGAAVLIALFLRAFVVEAFQIPSGSMIPTMEVGDRIFVNKFIYGLRIPFTNTKLFTYRKPKRGEVIVFVSPVEPDKDFIKRVVAVEGDTIAVRHNVLFVNGREVPQRQLQGDCVYWDSDERTHEWSDHKGCARFEEELDGHRYITVHSSPHSYGREYPDLGRDEAYVVPAGHVFVMGDNRDNSNDSRFWGPVPQDNIKGKALVIWLSMGEPEGFRWRRLGQTVD